jgi:hypothetical protein
MSDFPETPPPEWDLDEWAKALTIHVGVAYACEECGNLVMVTRGGVGIMELSCCHKPMKKLKPAGGRS